MTARRRRSVVAIAGYGRVDERGAKALVESLGHVGIEVVYLGAESSPRRIAATAAAEGADSIDLCVAAGGGGVRILRALLHELERIDRREVSIVVVHRVH